MSSHEFPDAQLAILAAGFNFGNQNADIGKCRRKIGD
jgi:hypothetical protein